MNTYIKKVSRTLLIVLAILAIALLVYLVYPKYRVTTFSISSHLVQVTRVNIFTGKTEIWLERVPLLKEKTLPSWEEIENQLKK